MQLSVCVSVHPSHYADWLVTLNMVPPQFSVKISTRKQSMFIGKKVSFLSFLKFCLLGVFLCDLNFDSYIIFSHSGNVSLTKQQDSTQ